jgi:putative ABC transport system permease protein
MSLLLRAQRRFLQRAPWSAGTALLGVALGVASVVAVHLISASVDRALTEAQPPHLLGITHLVAGSRVGASDYFRWRDAWRAGGVSDVSAVVPLVEGRVSIGERRFTVVGIDWLALPGRGGDGARSPRDGGGAPFSVPLSVIVGEAVLVGAGAGIAEGDRVEVAGRSFAVAGVVDGAGDDLLIADIAAAQVMLELPADALTQVGFAVADPFGGARRLLDRFMPGFSAGLPEPRGGTLGALLPGLGAMDEAREEDADRALVPVTAERPNAAFARSVLFNLGALGTLALVVAWFLIYQVAVIWLGRQRRVFDRLHGVGVSRGQLLAAFLGVMALIGVAATVLGLLFGVPLARALMAVSTRALPDASPAPMPVDVWLLLKAAASGLGVCVLGAFAAFHGSRSEALRRGHWRRWWPVAAGALLLVGVLVEASGVLGGFAAIAAICLLALALVRPVLIALRRAASGTGAHWLLRLAVRDVAWHHRVLGVALSALCLAVATGIGVGLMVESFRLDFARMLEARLSGDLYVSEIGGRVPEVARWLGGEPRVADVRPAGGERIRAEGVPADLGYGRFDAQESARYGHGRALGRGEALVSERLARELNVRPGARIAAAEGTLAVAAIFPGFGDAVGRLLVDESSLAELGIAAHFDRLTVRLEPQAGSETASAQALEVRLAARFPEARVASQQALRVQALAVFDRTFAITRALTLLALLVAAVGTYNALTALRLQQAPTLHLLRAQGLREREAWQLGVLRCALVGGIAVLLALPLGIAMAWALCGIINPRSFGWTVGLTLPVSGWLVPVATGLATALVAGMLPAPRERGDDHEAA